MTIKKRPGTAGARVKQLTDKFKAQVQGSRERTQILAGLGFDLDYEPTAEELAKRSIHALTVAMDCIVTALMAGEVVFKTAEGAVSALTQAAKLRSELVAQAGLNGQGVSDDDLEDEQERLRKAVGKIVPIANSARSRNQRKVSN